MKDNKSSLFLKIGTGYGLPETYVKQSFLEAYGFTVLNFNQHTVAALPNKVHALAGMTLYLPEDEIEDALALLESVGPDDCVLSHPLGKIASTLLSFFLYLLSTQITPRAIGFFGTDPDQLRQVIEKRKPLLNRQE